MLRQEGILNAVGTTTCTDVPTSQITIIVVNLGHAPVGLAVSGDSSEIQSL